ncbi:unnamed protein product [Calypogeia fissa]
MADSKAQGSESEAAAASSAQAEAAQKRKSVIIGSNQNEIISQAPQFGNDHTQRSPDTWNPGALPRNPSKSYSPSELTRVKSIRLGTAPELALGDLAHAKRARSIAAAAAAQVPPPNPLKVRLSVGPSSQGSSSAAFVAVSGASSNPLGQQAPNAAHPRPKSNSAPPPKLAKSFFFGSCFGGSSTPAATNSLLSPTFFKLGSSSPSPQVPRSRNQTSAPTQNIIVDSRKSELRPPPKVEGAEKKASIVVLDSIANKPTVETVGAEETSVAIAIPISSSCRCSVTALDAQEEAAKTATNAADPSSVLLLEPGAADIAGDSASEVIIMSNNNKAENHDPGISSGQQVLNADAEILIAAVKLADESESRQPSPESPRPSASSEARQSLSGGHGGAGVSPIRGLRPSYRELRPPGRRRRSDFNNADDEHPSPRARKSPYQGRSRSPHNNNYDNYEPSVTARGVERLFDSIIGREDFRSKEAQAAVSQSSTKTRSPKPRREPKPKDFRPCAPASNSPSNWAQPNLRVQWETEHYDREFLSERQARDREDRTHNSGLAAKSDPEASSSRDHIFSDLSDLPETSMVKDPETYLQDERVHHIQTGNREQMQESGRCTAAQEEFSSQKLNVKETGSPGPDVRWKKNDSSTSPESSSREARKKDPRRRGHPDPSFNPRPGDIIIRARKRAGLRLTDFYYYDNENYMEPGDQILRAKFDYLPPMDKMYLWCRLYVYSANNTYTFLDSTSESVGKLGAAADPGVDIRNLQNGKFFMGS